MDAYASWLRTVLNTLIKDLEYTYTEGFNEDCLCLFDEVTKIITIEIRDEVLIQELENIRKYILDSNFDGLPKLEFSAGFSTYIATLEINHEVIGRVYQKGMGLLADGKYLETDTIEHFGGAALGSLLRDVEETAGVRIEQPEQQSEQNEEETGLPDENSENLEDGKANTENNEKMEKEEDITINQSEQVNERGSTSQADKFMALISALLVFLLLAFVVIRNEPFADPNIVIGMRIFISLSASIFGASIPGFLNVQWEGSGFFLRAGGALALFAITFVFTPTVLDPYQ